MLPRSNEARIDRLTLHAADAVAARRDVAASLVGMDLHPPGLPPRAILVIRRMTLRTSPGAVGEALRAGVRERLARAVRADGGHVPHDADVVYFEDEVAVLAALASDAARREAPWWWAKLDLESTRERGPAAALASDLERVPAALQHLQDTGRLTPVLNALGDAPARELLVALANRFGLAAPPEPAESASGRPADGAPRRLDPTAAAWMRRGDPAGALAALGVALARAPGTAREPAFLHSILAFTLQVPDAAADRQAPAPFAPAAAAPDPGSAATANVRGGLAITQALPPLTPFSPYGLPVAAATPSIDAEAGADVAPFTGADVDAEPEAATERAPADPPRSPGRPESRPAMRSVSDLRTGWGGTFYLLNVALALDFYPDFTRPLDPGLPCSPWRFVAELGLRLGGPPFAEDPLWSTLITLADDEADDGAPWAPPVDWRPGWPTAGRYDGRAASFWAALETRVRWRIAEAIPDLLPERWLQQAAELQLGDDALTLTFALDAHPIEVRLAGLDRDPGFLPAAGRAVRFVYT